uniref:Protein yippee-like n=1 Tax=Chenopodium quinoa TaxID=63459 RepID=A0A803LWQ0_CHEQI
MNYLQTEVRIAEKISRSFNETSIEEQDQKCVEEEFLKQIQGRNSRAFLFSHAMNVDVGPKEDRHLMTGLHTVADVSCSDCREVLGWKYERAYEESQKYKEGKYILEKSKIIKDNW